MDKFVKIWVDVHERDSGLLEVIQGRGLQAEEKSLDSGDVVIYCTGKSCGIEIKRSQDYSNSLKEGRLKEQICGLYDNFEFPVVIVEGWKPYFSEDTDDEESIMEKVRKFKMSIRTLNRRICLFETSDMTETCDLIEEIARDMKDNRLFVMKRPIQVEPEVSDSMRILCSLSNVSRERAETLLDKYQTPQNAFNHLSEWHELKIGLTENRCDKIRQAWSEGT